MLSWNAPYTKRGRVWGWSPQLGARLSAAIEEFVPDVIHIHGAWWAAQAFAASSATKRGIPFVISFHGMLEPYHWSERGRFQLLRKRVYSAFYSSPKFRNASVIHAITPLEAKNLRRWYPAESIRVIPNAVKLDAVEKELAKLPSGRRRKVVGFLGRLHQKKGVDKLITAFRDAKLSGEWRLEIAGPEEDPRYAARLKGMARANGDDTRIDFLGAIFGRDRWDFLSRSWFVAAPSRSEVVAMVNLEAAACATPSITTFETGLTDWEEGGGCLVSLEGRELSEAILSYCSMSEEEIRRRGEASLRLVRSRYSWEAVGTQWTDLYRDVVFPKTRRRFG